jgi:hypothetical protein
MRMEIFVDPYEWDDQYTSVDEYVERNELDEGNVFALVRIDVGARTEFCICGGSAIPTSVAFPEYITEE